MSGVARDEGGNSQLSGRSHLFLSAYRIKERALVHPPSNGMASTVPLKQWIRGALDRHDYDVSLSGGGHRALSPSYLSDVLRIAVSLTQQICHAKQSMNARVVDDTTSLPSPFPAACLDWADCIAVRLKRNDVICKHDGLFANGRDGFHVQDARIVFRGGAANRVELPREKLQRIYSLGLVFYELFSGGELPPLEMLVVESARGGNLTVVSASQGEGDEERPERCQRATFGDFATALNLNNETSRSVNRDQSNSPSRKKRSVSSTSRQCVSPLTRMVLSNVSVDSLRVKGIPSALCDLICNMIDCINGDFRGNESYSEILDVSCNLQLMLEKPSVFLHSVDGDKLALTGLEIDNTLFA